MRKSKILIIALCVFMCTLTGCVTEYEQNDIVRYVKSEHRLKDFSVSENYDVYREEDGYEDRIWAIQMKEAPKLTFHVKDDYSFDEETETLKNELQDDYESVMLQYLYENYSKEMKGLKLVTNDRKGLSWSGLEGVFTNRQQIRTLYEDIKAFYDYIDETEFEIVVPVVFSMNHPLCEEIAYERNEGDYVMEFEKPLTEDVLWEADREYLLACMDYRLEEGLSEFTEDEIELALETYSYGIYIENEDKIAKKYAGLCANKYGYGISFSTLYEILVREEFDVKGNKAHYSFTGADGVKYEISNDFCDQIYEYDNQEVEGYYYLRNGEKVMMEEYFLCHFSEEKAREITGLILHISR